MSTVAQTVLDKSHLQLDGAGLEVFPDVAQNKSRPDDKSQRLAKSGRGEESDRGKRKTNTWDERTIEVTGLKRDATGDAIFLLLENELPEVVIQHIQRHPNKDVFYITFKTGDG